MPPPEHAHWTSTAAMSLESRTLVDSGGRDGRALSDVDDSVVASLVRARLRLARGQGWALFSTFGATFAASLALLGVLRHGLWIGAGVALMGSTAGALVFFVERGAWHVFARRGRLHGLSDDACARIYERATDAEAWIAVLTECGRAPSDAELACFVRPSSPRAGGDAAAFSRAAR